MEPAGTWFWLLVLQGRPTFRLCPIPVYPESMKILSAAAAPAWRIVAVAMFSTLAILFSNCTGNRQPPKWPYGVWYEVFVRAYADSNGDGIGDLNGLTGKLDYLKDLGVRGLWLMPVMPSPSYHK